MVHARRSAFNSSQLEYTCRCTGGHGTGLYFSASNFEIPYFFDQMLRLLFISLLVLCGYYSRVATIQGQHLFLWKARRHRRLDKMHTSETVTIVSHCQQYAQPLSPAVSCGNNSYNTNSPDASMVTIFSMLCLLAVASRVEFLSFKRLGLCSYYSRATSIQRNTVLKFMHTVGFFNFHHSGTKGDAVSKVSQYGVDAPVSCDKPQATRFDLNLLDHAVMIP